MINKLEFDELGQTFEMGFSEELGLKGSMLSDYGITDAYTKAEIDEKEKSMDEKKANKTDIPTKTSQLINDSDFTTNAFVKTTAKNTEKAAKEYAKQYTDDEITKAKTEVNGNTSKAVAELEKKHNTDISNLETKTNTTNNEVNKNKTDIEILNNTKADKTQIPTKTSQLNNDSDYTTKSYVDGVIKETKEEIKQVEEATQQAEEKIEGILSDIDAINDKAIINKATGTNIVLTDSANSKFRDIEITDTTNNEVTVDVYGKNLIDADILATGFEKQSDGSYKSITTIGRKEVPFYLPAGNTYTIRYLCKSGENKNYRIRLYYEDGAYWDTYIASTGEYQKHSFTKKLASAVVGISWWFSAGTGVVEYKELQIEVGAKETEYEEYKEKQTVALTLPLTDEGKEQFKNLHSNKPTTTILNDKNIEMSIDYEVDTKAYIDNKFNELNNAILSMGGNV